MKLRNLFVVFLFVLVAACNRVMPIKDIDSTLIQTGTGVKPSLEEVRVGIRRSVLSFLWEVEELDPYTLIATYRKGERWFKVTIAYTTEAYSITYLDSENYFYSGTKIHRRYNSWLKRLQKRISSNMARM